MADIMIGGLTCAYRVSSRAPAHGPAVVCVHGSGGDGVVWSYQLSRLSREYRIIIPDLPGHGQSAGQPCCRVEEYADWLERFVRALDLEDVYLMGHSLGGGIVQEYARRHPHRVQGLVLVGTAQRFVMSRAYVRELGLVQGADAAAPEIVCRAEQLLQATYAGHFHFLAQCGIGVLHADSVAAGRFDSTRWVSALRMPALVVAGGSDPIMPPDRSQELACALPNARFVLFEGAGHTVMLDRKSEFNAAVKTFIDEVVRGGDGLHGGSPPPGSRLKSDTP